MLLSSYFFLRYIQYRILPLAGHDVWVGDWVGDGDVSVHTDNDEVQDGGGAGPDIHAEPHEAEIPPEYPTVHHLVHCGEGQHQHAQQQVRHSE